MKSKLISVGFTPHGRLLLGVNKLNPNRIQKSIEYPGYWFFLSNKHYVIINKTGYYSNIYIKIVND